MSDHAKKYAEKIKEICHLAFDLIDENSCKVCGLVDPCIRGADGMCAKCYLQSIIQSAIDAATKEKVRIVAECLGEDINTADKRIAELEAAKEKLRKFVRYIIGSECFGESLDGGAIQEKAEELELIYEVKVTEDDLDHPTIREYGMEVGESWYKFMPILEPTTQKNVIGNLDLNMEAANDDT